MRFAFCLLLSLLTNAIWAQEFSKQEQYQQALQNAKTAFEAKQYSQAVLFYREAQQIKPESLLPRYKIEDIRTIYIEKEQIAYKTEHPSEVKKEKKLSKKEKLAQDKQEEDQLRHKATLKMDFEAEVVKKEMNTLKVSDIKIVEEVIVPEVPVAEMEPAETVREPIIKPIDSKKQELVQGGLKETTEPAITAEKRNIIDIKPVPKDSVETLEIEPVPAKKDVSKPIQKNDSKASPAKSQEDRKLWIEQEQKRLVVTYPNKKTVEELDKPGKHITRVIMNIDNKVIIYLKVQHSWGATYFFIEEVGQELKSINEQYFNLMTNLNTYGD